MLTPVRKDHFLDVIYRWLFQLDNQKLNLETFFLITKLEVANKKLNEEKEALTRATEKINNLNKELEKDEQELEDQKNQLEQQNIELQSLNNQKDEFLGIAAHDLRNPIGIVGEYSAIILEELSGN